MTILRRREHYEGISPVLHELATSSLRNLSPLAPDNLAEDTAGKGLSV